MVCTRRDGGCAHHQTQNSELGVCLSSAEHGGWAVGDLWGTLDIDPNPNRILLLHRFNKRPTYVLSQGTYDLSSISTF